MDLLLHLESIVSDFQHLFNQQNFSLFQVFLFGFMTHTPGGTLTHLYQSSGPPDALLVISEVSFPEEMGC